MIKEHGKNLLLKRIKANENWEVALFSRPEGRLRLMIDLGINRPPKGTELWLIMDGLVFQFDMSVSKLGGVERMTQTFEAKAGESLEKTLLFYGKLVRLMNTSN